MDFIEQKTNADILESGDQLIVVTGGRGVGKSFFATTFRKPSQLDGVFYIDSEDSANNVRANMQKQGRDFGYYLNLRQRFRDLPSDEDLLKQINEGSLPWVDKQTKNGLVGVYRFIMSELESKLQKGKYHTVIIDTGELLEAGIAAWVEGNKSKSGVTVTAYGRLWTDGVYPLYNQLLAALHARGVQTVMMSFHLKTPWEGNRPVVGKVVPAGKKILYPLSRFMIWLVRESKNPNYEPAGLILKERLGVLEIVDDEWRMRRMLPQRLPVATWKEIRRYLNEGCNFQNPAPGEVPTREELDLMSEMASDKQIELMLLDGKLELARQQAGESMILPGLKVDEDETTKTIREIFRGGTADPNAIIAKMMEDYGTEVELPRVLKVIRSEA